MVISGQGHQLELTVCVGVFQSEQLCCTLTLTFMYRYCSIRANVPSTDINLVCRYSSVRVIVPSTDVDLGVQVFF